MRFVPDGPDIPNDLIRDWRSGEVLFLAGAGVPVFIFSLTYTRARGGRRRALADGRTMVAGADDGERATGSSPTDRQIPRTDTGRLPSRAQLRL